MCGLEIKGLIGTPQKKDVGEQIRHRKSHIKKHKDAIKDMKLFKLKVMI